MLLYILAIISSTTDLLEGLIKIGDFYLSPMRICIVITFSIFITILLMKRHFKLGPIFKRVCLISIALISIIALSIINSPDTWYSAKRTFNFVSLILLMCLSYLLARTQKININTFFNVWLITGLFLCFMGGLQYLYELNYGTKALEYSHRKMFFLELKRISSLFKDPNFFGYYLISFLYLSIYYPYTKKTFLLKPYLILTALIFIILTCSRGAMIAIITSYIFFNALNNAKLRKILVSIFIIAMFGVLAFSNFKQVSFEDLLLKMEIIDVDEQSFVSRYLIWKSGMNLISTYPLLGIGPGNFTHVEKGQFLERISESRKGVISVAPGHSNYIEIAAESGIVALSGYVLLIVYILISIKRAMKIDNREFNASLKWIFLSIMGMSIANLFLSYYSFPMFFLMGIGIYLSEKGMKNASEQT